MAEPQHSANAAAEADLPLLTVDRSRAAARRQGWLRWLLLRLWRLPILWALVAGGALIGMYFQPPGLRFIMETLEIEPGAGTDTPIAVPVASPPETSAGAVDDAAPPAASEVLGLGRLLPVGDVALVSPPYGAGDARIVRVTVSEGDRVAKDDLIAVLDNEESLRAAIADARATVAQREADVERTRASIRASEAEARAALARAEAEAENARLAFARTDQLYRRGFAAKAAWDRDAAAARSARRAVEQARATLSRYSYAHIDDQPDVRLALSAAAAARSALSHAERDMARAYVRAPQDGTILALHVRPGERPSVEGIAEIGNIDRMIAEVEIFQSEIGRVNTGAQVELEAAALGAPLRGTVTRVGVQIRRQTMIDDDPAANTDARVVEVAVTLDPESSLRARAYTNLQVRARIDAETP